MTTPAPVQTPGDIMQSVLMEGDLSRLSKDDRVTYFNKVCESLGLNPYTKPFDYMKLGDRTVLYARKDATDQLRNLHKISLELCDPVVKDNVLSIRAKAKMPMPDGSVRQDEDIGAVVLPDHTRPDARANAIMKCTTKAKRRVTLSICGLGFLDETEVRDVAREEPPPKTIRSISEGLNNVVGKAKSERGKAEREQLKAAGLDDEDIEEVLEDMGELEEGEFDEETAHDQRKR